MKDIFLEFNFLLLSWHPYSYRWGLVQLLHLLLEKQWNIYIYACWCVLKWISIWYRWRNLWFTSIYIYLTDCFCIHFMFTLFCAQNWFVFDANFNSPNNQDGLFLKYQIILVSCLHVQINSIKSNKEINCTGIQNSQRYMYSVNYFTKPFLTSNYPVEH